MTDDIPIIDPDLDPEYCCQKCGDGELEPKPAYNVLLVCLCGARVCACCWAEHRCCAGCTEQ